MGADDRGGALKVVLVGFGTIAQAKYVPALLKLSSLYDVIAIVEPSAAARALALQRFPAARALAELPGELAELGAFDAGLLLTPPVVRPALTERLLDHGVHVLAEKPLALTAATAVTLALGAVARRRLLMVAQTRRFDPGCAQLVQSLEPGSVTTALAVTLETRWQSIVELAPLARAPDPATEFDRPLGEAELSEISSTLGTDDDRVLRYYRWAIAESLVHDLDLLAYVLGPVSVVEACTLARRDAAISALIRVGDVDVVLQWTLAPGLAGYEQTFQFTGQDRRHTLRYPSPFLPNATARLTVDSAGEEPTGHISVTTVRSYEDPFVRLLEEFAARVAAGDASPASAFDAATALRVGESLVRAHLESRAVEVQPLAIGTAT
jgi:predicted dehydrogenase